MAMKMFFPGRNRSLAKILENNTALNRREYRRSTMSEVEKSVPTFDNRSISSKLATADWKKKLFQRLAAMQAEQIMTEKRRQKARQLFQQTQNGNRVECVPVEKSNPQIPLLSEKIILVIKEAFRSPPGQVLVDISRQSVTRGDLETLLGLNWLNDAIINAYLNLIVSRSKQNPSLPKVYTFNTFFLTHYVEMGYSAVRRWTRKDDIFSYDILLVPVHLGMHWCMAIVDLREKQIKYMDSMGGRNDECLGMLLDYLGQEMEDKKKLPLDFEEWQLNNIQNLPQQQNGSDCGMFALKYADYVAQDAEINFSQSDMPYFRKRMMFEMLQSAILDTGYGKNG